MSDRREHATPVSEAQAGETRPRARSLHGWLRAHPPLVVFGVTLLFWLAFVAVDARGRWGGDIRGFLCLGAVIAHPAALAGAPAAGPYGYDGQYYSALTLDPLLRRRETAGLIDTPSYRATRILVPLLAWILALGSPAAAPYLYLLVCWGAGLASVWLVARWLEEERGNAWWALWLGCSGGLAAALIRATPDTAALLLVVVALCLHRTRRITLTIVALCMAVLARETSVLAVGAIALQELLAKRYRTAAAVAVMPAIPALAWQLYLRHVLGSAFNSGHGNFGAPLTWVPDKLHQVFGGHSIWWMEAWGLAAIVVGFVAVAVVLARPRAWDAVDITFVGFGVLALLLNFNVYVEGWAYGRVLVVLPFLAVVLANRQKTPFRRGVLRGVAVCYAFLGLLMVRGELHGAVLGRSPLRAMREGAPQHKVIAPPAPPRIAASPTATATPAQRFVLYVMPVAHATGVAGSEWRTDLAVTNLAGVANTVTAELLLAEQANDHPDSRTGELGPYETRDFADVLESAFSHPGLAALRLTAAQGPISASGRTFNAARQQPASATLAAFPATAAIGPGKSVRVAGLVGRKGDANGARTNLAVLNLSPKIMDVEVVLLDDDDCQIGRLSGLLRPFELKQVTDLFAVAGVRGASASALLRTTTPGGEFLAVGTVIRANSGEVSFLLPH